MWDRRRTADSALQSRCRRLASSKLAVPQRSSDPAVPRGEPAAPAQTYGARYSTKDGSLWGLALAAFLCRAATGASRGSTWLLGRRRWVGWASDSQVALGSLPPESEFLWVSLSTGYRMRRTSSFWTITPRETTGTP